MSLKTNIQQAFEDNLDNAGDIEDIAKLLTDYYKESVEDGKDSINNVATGVNYDTIESAIIAQFNLSFNSSAYLAFTLIEAALVTGWSTASMKLPASNPPGFSVVANVSVVTSIPPGTTPLIESSDGYDNIVNKFFEMFDNHAKSISFLYTGSSTSSPPVSIVTTVNSYTIK